MIHWLEKVVVSSEGEKKSPPYNFELEKVYNLFYPNLAQTVLTACHSPASQLVLWQLPWLLLLGNYLLGLQGYRCQIDVRGDHRNRHPVKPPSQLLSYLGLPPAVTH